MGTDIANLCLMAVVALAGFALASRQMGRGRGYPRGGTGGSGQLPRGGGRRGGQPATSDDTYLGGRPRGELFPDRGDSQPPSSRPSEKSGSSGFPQANDTRRSGGFDKSDENGYGGRRGGSLFPPKDDK